MHQRHAVRARPPALRIDDSAEPRGAHPSAGPDPIAARTACGPTPLDHRCEASQHRVIRSADLSVYKIARTYSAAWPTRRAYSSCSVPTTPEGVISSKDRRGSPGILRRADLPPSAHSIGLDPPCVAVVAKRTRTLHPA